MDFFVVCTAAVGILLAISLLRKGKVGMEMTSRKSTLSSRANPAEVFAILMRNAAPYRIDAADEASKQLVLSSSISIASWGFLYPVVIREQPNGGSEIVIGCTSKVFQLGPVVTSAHRKCVNMIETLLSPPTARVA